MCCCRLNYNQTLNVSEIRSTLSPKDPKKSLLNAVISSPGEHKLYKGGNTFRVCHISTVHQTQMPFTPETNKQTPQNHPVSPAGGESPRGVKCHLIAAFSPASISFSLLCIRSFFLFFIPPFSLHVFFFVLFFKLSLSPHLSLSLSLSPCSLCLY